MNTNVTTEDIESVIGGMLARVQDELKHMTQQDLEKSWYFEYNPAVSPAWNLYQFYSMLNLYANRCRRWEEMHHGSMSVVERVRDAYIMPKIRAFIELHDARTLSKD